MTLQKYHLTKDEKDIWSLKKEGSNKASVVFGENKTNSVKEASIYMKNHGGSMIIHKENGQFQEERTYPKSADPRKSKG